MRKINSFINFQIIIIVKTPCTTCKISKAINREIHAALKIIKKPPLLLNRNVDEIFEPITIFRKHQEEEERMLLISNDDENNRKFLTVENLKKLIISNVSAEKNLV